MTYDPPKFSGRVGGKINRAFDTVVHNVIGDGHLIQSKRSGSNVVMSLNVDNLLPRVRANLMIPFKILTDEGDGAYTARKQIVAGAKTFGDSYDETVYTIYSVVDVLKNGSGTFKPDDIVLAKYEGIIGSVPIYNIYYDGIGTHTNPKILGPESYTSTSADTDTWDITAQGTDGNGTPYDGVVLKWPYRVVWSSPNLKAFTRQCTYDSAGNLVLVAAETETTIVEFVECTTST